MRFFFTFQFLFSCPTCLWMHRGVVNPPVKAACLHYLALYWLEQDILPQSTPKLLLWRSDSLTLSFCKFTFSQNSTACICISQINLKLHISYKLYFVISVFSSKTTHKGALFKKMTKYLPIWGYLTIRLLHACCKLSAFPCAAIQFFAKRCLSLTDVVWYFGQASCGYLFGLIPDLVWQNTNAL